jgi:hypothetical protein
MRINYKYVLYKLVAYLDNFCLPLHRSIYVNIIIFIQKKNYPRVVG